MTRADELLALAELVEALTGPDREVDAEIAIALGWNDVRYDRLHGNYWEHQVGDEYEVGRVIPEWTASLDAAMTLVPAECLFATRTVWDRGNMGGFASVSRYELAEPGNMLKRYWMDEHQTVAATPALALTAAALRALAAIETGAAA